MAIGKLLKHLNLDPKILHLFFADDFILFAEASSQQAFLLKTCLDNFCALFGQTVSFEKSLMFCSPNTSKSTASLISNVCGSPLTCDLGKYLDMPLIHDRVNKCTYAGSFDKVQKRLSSWKSKVLSFAGRLTLVQSVTSAIPMYAMQTTKFPFSLCDKLDKLNRDFIWGDVENKKMVHLVNWDTICQPKYLGGLGIKKTADMNQAMLSKIGWDVELLLSVLPREIVNLIVNVPSGFNESGDDTRIWCSTSNGQFSVKSAYSSIFYSSDPVNPQWKAILYGSGETSKFLNLVFPTGFKKIIWDYALEWRKSKLKSNDNYMFNYTMHAWKKPPEIFFKLNVDGTRVSPIAWGLFHGLKLAVSLNIKNLIIESDSAILVQLMNNSEFGNHPLGSLLQGCSSLMNKMENATLSHIFRECNSTADALAKCSISHELGLVCFDSPPAHVADAFLDDLCAVSKAMRAGNCFSI
ncbi:hypothetical protein ACLB2K_011973 [Fragaria x ananassa]